MANIKKFSFFKSYYESLKDLEKDDKNEIINAILEYVFEDKKPKFRGIKKTIWTLIEPNLNTSKNRSNPNSGAPLGNKNASKEKQSKNNQNSTERILGIGVGKGIGIGVGVGDNISPPDTHTQIFNFCLSVFPEYDENDLEKSCKKFFLNYKSKKWEGIVDWEAKLEQWIQQDIEDGKIQEKRKKDIDPDRVLMDENGKCYKENYDGTRYYI